MNIKRFIGADNQEALRMVKKEMGPDAVILGTRSLPSPGGGPRRVEVTAAVDFSPPEAPAGRPGQGTFSQTDALVLRWDSLEKELRDIKSAILRADAGRGLSPEVYFNPAVRARYDHFQSFGLRPEVIEDLMVEVHENRPSENQTESDLLRDSLSRVLRRVNVGLPKRPSNGGPEICAFIGPTGVGKTTTLAKLAARRAVKSGDRTVLITLDTFRIAAVNQLQTYARIMEVPLEVASGRIELEEAIRRHRDADLILIDTAGRSPNRREDMDDIARVFHGLKDVHHFLVLSAATDLANLLRAAERFGRLPCQSTIFTKLDEIRDGSPMINFLISSQKPVSYFTTGQQVPDDMEKATRKRLARLMLGMPRGTAYLFRDPKEGTGHGSGNRTPILGRGSYGKA